MDEDEDGTDEELDELLGAVRIYGVEEDDELEDDLDDEDDDYDDFEDEDELDDLDLD